MKEKFSTALNMAIEKNGLNPTAFSDKIGVSPNSVLKWIRGETFPKPDKWQMILGEIGINPQHYVDYSTGEKGTIQSSTQTNTTRTIGNMASNGPQVVIMDETGITMTGYDNRNPPPAVDTDSWAELMHWITKHPSMVPGLVIEARRIGEIFDSAITNK